MICGLFGGAALAIRRGSENPLVDGRMKTSNASPQVIELNPICFRQAHSKGSSTGPRNENTEYVCAFGVLGAPSTIRPLNHAVAYFR